MEEETMFLLLMLCAMCLMFILVTQMSLESDIPYKFVNISEEIRVEVWKDVRYKTPII